MLLTGHFYYIYGQGCNFSISVPKDITICQPDNVNLGGIINGNYLGFNWTGPNGYYEDQNLNPSVFISQTSTFKLKVFGDAPTNLIVNGDFSAGNSGFTTDYQYQQDIPGYTQELWNEGTYSIVSNPSFVHTNFAPCGDHTGGGNMMVVNGAASLSRVWCQTVTVVPNTTYIFQAFATSVEGSSPAILQFSINNVLLGAPINLSGQTCLWQEFYEIWQSGGATSVEICITNQNLNPSGNDFALDDIFFGPLCEEEKEFTITVSDFTLAPSIPQVVNCLNPQTNLIVQPIPFSNDFGYSWYTADGIIKSNTNQAEIVVEGAGTYIVTVTDGAGCTKEEVFEVYGDFTKPAFSISGDLKLSCTKKSTNINLTTFSNISDITWTFPDLSEHKGMTITATAAGKYKVEVIGENGCKDIQEFEIKLEKSQFLYQSDSSGVLTCTIKDIDIYLDIQSKIDSIQWTGPDIIFQNKARDTINIGKEGYYVFELFYGSECSLKDSVKINLQPSLIQYKLPNPDTITCLQRNVKITPDSLKNVKDIFWDIAGNPLNSDTLNVMNKGVYYFTLSDKNGCTQSDSIQVYDDLILPVYSVNIDAIDCINDAGSFEVNGSGLYTYLWTGEKSTSSSSNPQFTEEGDYTLVVTGPNGCKDTASYYLPSIKDFPIINGYITAVTCSELQGTITISASIPSTISWSGPNGATGSGALITSKDAGIYTITALSDLGCESKETFELPIDTIKPQLQPIQNFELTCAKDTYTPLLSYNSYHHYLWEGSGLDVSTPIDVTLNVPGSYAITLFNANGCFIKRTFIVTENKPLPDFSVVADILNCKAPSTPLIISGQSDYIYTLDNSKTITNGYNIDEPGIHTLTAINAQGCEKTISFTIVGSFNIPKITLNPILLNCYHPEKWLKNVGSDQNLTLNWETSTGSINADSVLISSIQPVTLIATNSDGCEARMTASITSDFEKPDLQIAGSNVIKCTEDFIVLNGQPSSADSYKWTNENGQVLTTNIDLSVTSPGLYFLEGLNSANGCSNTASIQIVKQPTPDYIQYTATQPLCFGDSGQFIWIDGSGGTAPYTLQLNERSIKHNDRVDLKSGVYYITLLDVNGCFIKDTFLVETPKDFAVDAGRDTVINLGSTYVLQPITTLNQQEIKDIIWEPATSLNCNNCFNPIASPDFDTRYTITIYNENGCIKKDHVTVRVQFIKGYIAPNIFRPDSRLGNNMFTIFPVENSIRIIRSLSIYDRWGNLMFTTKDIPPASPEEGWNGHFLGRDVQPGVYVWKAEIEYKDDSIEIATGDITIIR